MWMYILLFQSINIYVNVNSDIYFDSPNLNA